MALITHDGSGLRAFLVSVDYHDLFEVTLNYNQRHFSEINIITSTTDTKTLDVVKRLEGRIGLSLGILQTDVFYDNGADFNKWAALEKGLDTFGRHGWICLMDADVLWPAVDQRLLGFPLQPGYLYSPLRRMLVEWERHVEDGKFVVPMEPAWNIYPIHSNVMEWAGYTQIFHGTDPVLPAGHWHQTDWRHAGGADSYFQMLWARDRKIRPEFEVLHLGEAGKNWCGRSTAYLDGSRPPDAAERAHLVKQYQVARFGKVGPSRHDHEKLGG